MFLFHFPTTSLLSYGDYVKELFDLNAKVTCSRNVMRYFFSGRKVLLLYFKDILFLYKKERKNSVPK